MSKKPEKTNVMRILDRAKIAYKSYDYSCTAALSGTEVAAALGMKGKTDQDKLERLIKAIRELRHKIGIKDTIADYGISEEDFLATLDEMTENAFDDQCTGANPRYPLLSEIKQMYLNAYYGRTFTEKEYPKA